MVEDATNNFRGFRGKRRLLTITREHNVKVDGKAIENEKLAKAFGISSDYDITKICDDPLTIAIHNPPDYYGRIVHHYEGRELCPECGTLVIESSDAVYEWHCKKCNKEFLGVETIAEGTAMLLEPQVLNNNH